MEMYTVYLIGREVPLTIRAHDLIGSVEKEGSSWHVFVDEGGQEIANVLVSQVEAILGKL